MSQLAVSSVTVPLKIASDEATNVSVTAHQPPPVAPPIWLPRLTVEEQQAVQWVAAADLKEHPACAFLPFYQSSFERVKNSVQRMGVLFPIAVAKDGRVLDGRYRRRAALELGIEQLPTLVIDVEGDQAAEWVFAVKNDREHLSEDERAVLAVQYQARLKKKNVKQRTEKMNKARKIGATDKRQTSLPKADSRKETCKHFKLPERKFRAMQRLSNDRPDLFKQVVAGELDPAIALKRKGKNFERARATAAKEIVVRPQDLSDTTMENKIHVGEAQDVLKRVDDGIASLVVFSPPYFDVPVEYDPPLLKKTYPQYLDEMLQTLTESFRVSRSGGRLVMVVDTVKNTEPGGDEMLPLFADLTKIARRCGWKFWIDIAWLKSEVCGSKTTFGSLGRCSAPGWGRDHEWILLFYKDIKKLEGDSELCDLTPDEHLAWWKTTWQIAAETRKEILACHPAPYPEELVERLTKLLTYRRDLIIDPMNGSGTSTAVANRLGRRFIGIDRSPIYCAFADERLKVMNAFQ